MCTQSRALKWARHHLEACSPAGSRLCDVCHRKAARLCQSSPKVPQLCSVQNISDITSPKYHFHDDTTELAELLAFQHHFKMTTGFFVAFRMEVWISSHSNHSMYGPFFCFWHFFSRSTFNYRTAQTKDEKARLSLEKSLIDSSLRKPETKLRRLALVLQTEKLLTHPASCHQAKGSTNPPLRWPTEAWQAAGIRRWGDARKKPGRKRQKEASRQ